MLQHNFRKKKSSSSNRPNYLRYDDVFMSNEYNENYIKQNNRSQFSNSNSKFCEKEEDYQTENYNDYDQYEEDVIEEKLQQNRPSYKNNEYFSPKNNIINDRMVKYQKRHLPPLQMYGSNNTRDMYNNMNNDGYWDDNEDLLRKRTKNGSALAAMWQKFIITFTSILSLVCISWIAYNWNSDKQQTRNTSGNGPLIIEPDQPSFKVFPENPVGERISHKDKTVYERVDPEMSSLETDAKLLPPQEEQGYIPDQQKITHENSRNDVEEYSIIDDKTYYIKISAGKNKQVLENESKLIKKKFSNFLSGKSCLVKKVSNNQGEQKHAILIGPFESQENAVNTAKDLGGQCYIISVKE